MLPGDRVFPEGIAYQQLTGDFFVSSTTDGTIFRGNVRNPQAEVFLPGNTDGRTSATGLKVDRQGRLFVSGGATGKIFVYDTKTKALLAALDVRSTGAVQGTFVNDVALTRSGDAYFTDSVNPYLYRVFQNAEGEYEIERFVSFAGTPFAYQAGFNANGIAATPDGKYLIVVQSNTGKLFRISTRTKEVVEIGTGGTTLTNGDGILLHGHTLYVVRNQNAQIVKLQLSGDYARATFVSSSTDPSFAFPTTIARAKGRLLVVNSQFNKRGPGLSPALPFTVSSVRAP